MNNITRYEIDMLDVKAADAFLIHAYVDTDFGFEREYVVLVDAGNEGDGETIYNHIKKYYNQKYIDLVVITHCDTDHYGGMQYLVNKHKDTNDGFSIREVWVHDPYKHVDVDDVKYIRKSETLRDRLNAAYAFSDGSNLLELLDDSQIFRREVFTGDAYDDLNITVLGPDLGYYESLIPDFRVDLDFKEEQDDEDIYAGLICFIQKEAKFYSKALEDAYDDKSKVNQSSIVFLFQPNNQKYLFTGDAGKEALHRIVDTDKHNLLADIDWLKVPHHGSKHNIDNAIISHLKPKISCISTEKIKKYANQCTINALKKVGDVYSTHKERRSLWHSQNTSQRDDYSSAKPL